MAPTKNSNGTATSNRSVSKEAAAAIAALIPLTRKGVNRNKNIQDQNMDIIQTRGKRKADDSSPIKNDKIKRSALGNLTNNVNKLTSKTLHSDEDAKQKPRAHVLKDTQNLAQDISNALKAAQKVTTRAAAKNAKNKIATISKAIVGKNEIVQSVGPTQKVEKLLPPPAPQVNHNAHSLMPAKACHKSRRISNEFNQTEDSLYMSALEDISISESMRLSGNFEVAKRRSILLQQQQQLQIKKGTEIVKTDTDDTDDDKYRDVLSALKLPVPEDVEDFDKIHWNDPFQVSKYAMDIFNYLKTRESEFIIDDYMPRQIHLSKFMRSLLVDWMVEVQESFELNHETLYLAVKIVDSFLCKEIVHKERLQLVGAAALFIACKYDERSPPLIEDFLYISDGAYKHEELVRMEMTVLRTIGYDLGIPLSYRFLRRYARCAKVPMTTLTLARYILELSLMDYETISLSDSKLACAALFMAIRMQAPEKQSLWSSVLNYYTGYKLIEFADIMPILNACLHRKPNGTIQNIRKKYSHKIFHEVAKIKLLSTEQLFAHESEISLFQSANKRIEKSSER